MKNTSVKNEKTLNIKSKFFEAVLVMISSVAVGIICGGIGGAFAKSIGFVTQLRTEHEWLLYLLPFGGLLTVVLYKLTKTEGIGTDRAIESATGKARTPVLLMPVVFTASVMTHLFGGSAGKEGAALQLGSGVAELVSKLVKADEKMHNALAVCGMAALFSAAFGTPVGACIFALEVAVVGKINLFAAFPSAVSSFTAYCISVVMGVSPERFSLNSSPDLEITVLIKTAAISLIVSVAAGIFCHILRGGKELIRKLIKNPYLSILAGGCAIIVLTLIFGTDYNGGGMFLIDRIFEDGIVRPEAFVLKFVFTVITVCTGFKGGEIVPSFVIGATLGAVLSGLFGLPAAFCAAIGMVAFFSAVTNCQMAAAVIAVELFGAKGFVFFALAAFSARAIFPKISLYNKQEFNF